jgi:hypothetical protein
MKRNADFLQFTEAPDIEPEIPAEGSRPAPRGTAAYPRRRANKACQVCRARRTKCDNKKPTCSFCEKIGAKCIVSPTDLSSFDPASLLILERLEDLKQCLVAQNRPRTASPETLFDDASKLQDLELELDNHSLGFMNFENVLSWPVFRGRFDECLDIKSRLARSEAAITRRFSQPLRSAAQINLDLGTCHLLLESFLENVHVKNPVLDDAKVRVYIAQVCSDGLGWDVQSCLVVSSSSLSIIFCVLYIQTLSISVSPIRGPLVIEVDVKAFFSDHCVYIFYLQKQNLMNGSTAFDMRPRVDLPQL